MTFVIIVGWLALVAMLLGASFAWFIVAVNGLGKWSLSGALNTLRNRLIIIAIGVLIFVCWCSVLHSNPF